jgi:hypothetical protein
MKRLFVDLSSGAERDFNGPPAPAPAESKVSIFQSNSFVSENMGPSIGQDQGQLVRELPALLLLAYFSGVGGTEFK